MTVIDSGLINLLPVREQPIDEGLGMIYELVEKPDSTSMPLLRMAVEGLVTANKALLKRVDDLQTELEDCGC